MPKLTIEDIEMLEKDAIFKAQRDFYSYRQYISDFKLKTGWFVREISNAIEQFYYDYEDGKRPILVIQAPPQHGKSEAVSDGIAWMAGRDPSLRFIYASFSERLGIRANLKLQRVVTSPKYGKIFPDIKINGRGNIASEGYQRNKEMVEFAGQLGSFRNTTVRGSITGETLDIGIIDDPIKGREEASSLTVRDKTWNWFTDDFLTRFDEYAGLIIILTRWHIDDPVGRLLAQNKNVKLLSFQAIAEKDEKHRKAGEALFPKHKSVEFLLSRKSTMPAANWMALYQQNPQPPGGNMFKSDWWRYYKVPPKTKWRAIYADTAQKVKQKNDYSVLQCWGESYEGKAVLLDQLRGKWEAPELLVNARAFWNKHKAVEDMGILRCMKIEDKVSGTGLIQTLQRESIPVIPVQRNIDKVLRGQDASPFIESGHVLIPEQANWLSDYLDEFSQFPNGAHDDQVDPTMDAITDILQGIKRDYGALL